VGVRAYLGLKTGLPGGVFSRFFWMRLEEVHALIVRQRKVIFCKARRLGIPWFLDMFLTFLNAGSLVINDLPAF
jgi:hypothetical protein